MKKRTRLSLLVGLIVSIVILPSYADHPSATFGAGQAGPLITIPATTLDSGQWTGGFRTERVDHTPLADATLEQAARDGEAVHSVDSLVTHFATLAYGVNERLTLGLTLPYINREGVREGEIHAGNAEVHRINNIKGIGDATLLGQYRLNANNRGTRYSVLAGLQLPTGDDDVAVAGAHIEPEFQPGSGEWHPVIGVAASFLSGKGNLDANLLYLHTREGAHHTRIGSLLNYNVAWSRRFNNESMTDDHDHADHFHITWDAIIELNGEWRGKNDAHGVEERHSGGNQIYLTPGIRVTLAERLSLHASVGAPVLDDHNGQQADVDYRTNIGLGLIF